MKKRHITVSGSFLRLILMAPFVLIVVGYLCLLIYKAFILGGWQVGTFLIAMVMFIIGLFLGKKEE